MGLLKRLRNRKSEPAGYLLETKIRDAYVRHAGKPDADDLMYSDLYRDLNDKVGLDIATVISLIQIAIFIWQWFKKSQIPAERVAYVELPDFDFQDDHEAALGTLGQKLGLAA